MIVTMKVFTSSIRLLTVSLLASDDAVEEIRPSFLVPSGSTSPKMVLRGQVLELECIAAGL